MIPPIPLTTPQALDWIQLIFAAGTALHTLELIAVRESFADQGIWRAKTLEAEWRHFFSPVHQFLKNLLSYRFFLGLLLTRLFCALILGVLALGALAPDAGSLPSPFLSEYSLLTSALQLLCISAVALSSILISLRWRGTFNGGADYMSLIVVFSLLLARATSMASDLSAAPTQNETSPINLVAIGPKLALYYLAVQSALSYFIAGVVKLRQPEWRNGTALIAFLTTPGYSVPLSVQRLRHSPQLAMALSWFMMLWEFCFAFLLFFPETRAACLVLGWLFHLSNVYILGLNRFFFTWWATYPALLWLPYSF